MIDTHGLLLRAYGLADGAFVGGGLHGARDHNFAEPLVFGIGTWTGPFHYYAPERWALFQRRAPELVIAVDKSELLVSPSNGRRLPVQRGIPRYDAAGSRRSSR